MSNESDDIKSEDIEREKKGKISWKSFFLIIIGTIAIILQSTFQCY